MKKPVAGATCQGPVLVPMDDPRRQSSKATHLIALACDVSVHLPTRSSAESGSGAVHHVALDLALVRPVGHEFAHDPVCVERRDALVHTEDGVGFFSGGFRTAARP